MNLTLRQRLDTPNKDGRCYVFLDVTWPQHRATLPTGVKCQPAHFRADKAQPISPKDPAAGHLNARLNALKAVVLKLVGEYCAYACEELRLTQVTAARQFQPGVAALSSGGISSSCRMKRLFLSIGFTVAVLAAQAQVGAVGQLITIGLNPTSRNNLANNVLRDEPYVPQATRRLKLKRTPAEKLPKKGSAAITALETLLQQCYTTYAADSLTEIIGPDQYQAFSAGRRKAQTLPSSWDIRPYDEEMAFYQEQDHIRRARRERAARLPPPPPDSPDPARR